MDGESSWDALERLHRILSPAIKADCLTSDDRRRQRFVLNVINSVDVVEGGVRLTGECSLFLKDFADTIN